MIIFDLLERALSIPISVNGTFLSLGVEFEAVRVNIVSKSAILQWGRLTQNFR